MYIIIQSVREASLNLAVRNTRSVGSAANLALFEQVLGVGSSLLKINSVNILTVAVYSD